MHHRASRLFLSIGFSVGVAAWAPQVPGGGQPAIRACSLLTKELVLKVTAAANKKVLDLIPPEEESIGATGSACEYGDVRLQIDPFPPARVEELRKQQGKDWTPVPGVGDNAYFRDNRGRFAELIVAVGAHTFTVQMGVPIGGTADAIKPNVITVANAIVPKLR
jgi:hypothetical protein